MNTSLIKKFANFTGKLNNIKNENIRKFSNNIEKDFKCINCNKNYKCINCNKNYKFLGVGMIFTSGAIVEIYTFNVTNDVRYSTGLGWASYVIIIVSFFAM
jgi:hypothetical protein